MKNFRFFPVLLCALVTCACGNNSETSVAEKVKYVYTEDEMYEKVWESKVIHNESVVLKENNKGEFCGRLLYTPKEIISVRDHTLTVKYSEETDYYVEGDMIYMKKGSKMPHLTQKNLTTEEVPQLFISGDNDGTYDGKTSGTKILFTEGVGVIFSQIMVSYTHEDSWTGTVPAKKGDKLPDLQAKLQNKEEINLVTFGDSIFCGCNASGLKGFEPFQDPFPDGFASEIKRKYNVEVVPTNLSLGGALSIYGSDNAGTISSYDPDILVIGFGMNDGSFKVSPSVYKEHIEKMITETQKTNPDCAIIVCATILPSEVSPQSNGNHREYVPVLNELEDAYDNVVVMDMTSYTETLFTKKYSMDLFANNINHPADWLTRQYVANLMNVIDM